MGRIRDLKRIRDTKGTFHAKIGTIKDRKDRNSMDLTKAEEIKRWQEYTELSYPEQSWWCGHSPRTGHPKQWGQVGLRKHYYEQS